MALPKTQANSGTGEGVRPLLIVVDSAVSQMAGYAEKFGEGFELVRYRQFQNVSPEIYKNRSGVLVLAAIHGEGEYQFLVRWLDREKKRVKSQGIRFFVLSSLNRPDVNRMLRKLGVVEVCPSSSKEKTVEFKIRQNCLQYEKLLEKQNNDKAKLEAQKKRESLGLNEDQISYQAPLGIVSDCWVLESPNDLRNVMGKWIVNLVGPRPLVGRWVSAKLIGLKVPELWRFTSVGNEFQDFVPDMGNWYFIGKEPKFIDGKWSFIGENVQLFFKSIQDGKNYVRFEGGTDDKLSISENREDHASLLKAILGEEDPKTQISSAREGSQKRTVPHKQMDKLPHGIPPAQQNHSKSVVQLMEQIDAKPGELPLYFGSSAFKKGEDSESKKEQRERSYFAYINQENTEELFKRLDSEKSIRDRIQEAVESKCRLHFWVRGDSETIDLQVTHIKRVGALEVIFDSDTKTKDFFSRKIKEKEEPLFFMTFSLFRGRCFTAIPKKDIRFDELGVIIPVPEKLFEVNRRKNFRLPIYPYQTVKVLVENPKKEGPSKIEYRLLNISSGGLALIIPVDLEEYYKKNQFIHSFRLAISGMVLTGSLDVRWCREIDLGNNEKTAVLGCKFGEMPGHLRKMISEHVHDESEVYFESFFEKQSKD